MLKQLKQLSSEILAENRYWKYLKDRYTHPGGDEGEYHYVHTPGSVMVIPVTEKGNLLLVRQFRYLNRREGLEFVGGGVRGGLSAESAAASELKEEAGLVASELREIGEFNPMNGVTDEICKVFVATDLVTVDAAPDASEEFELVELRHDEFCDLIRHGEIWDGMTLAAFSLFREKYTS
jgi:ADP-ribose pyrophosphatase